MHHTSDIINLLHQTICNSMHECFCFGDDEDIDYGGDNNNEDDDDIDET